MGDLSPTIIQTTRLTPSKKKNSKPRRFSRKELRHLKVRFIRCPYAHALLFSFFSVPEHPTPMLHHQIACASYPPRHIVRVFSVRRQERVIWVVQKNANPPSVASFRFQSQVPGFAPAKKQPRGGKRTRAADVRSPPLPGLCQPDRQ